MLFFFPSCFFCLKVLKEKQRTLLWKEMCSLYSCGKKTKALESHLSCLYPIFQEFPVLINIILYICDTWRDHFTLIVEQPLSSLTPVSPSRRLSSVWVHILVRTFFFLPLYFSWWKLIEPGSPLGLAVLHIQSVPKYSKHSQWERSSVSSAAGHWSSWDQGRSWWKLLRDGPSLHRAVAPVS